MKTIVEVAALLAVMSSPGAAQTNGDGAIEIPLRIHGGRLIVPVLTADDVELDFILGTANSVTVFSESGASRVEDQAGISLGGQPVPTENAQTIPDERLLTDGVVFDGMIGANMLNQFDILIDAPGGRLVLKPVGRSVEWEGMTMSDPSNLRIFHGMIISLDVEMNGEPYPAMLDLGTPALIANERAGAENDIDGEGTASLRVGNVDFPGIPVKVDDLEVMRRFSPNGDGFLIVGSPIAHKCAIAISWVHQEIRTCVR